MAVRIIYKAAAEAEIEGAYSEHEAIRRGPGVEFLAELVRIEGHLQANPLLYQKSTAICVVLCCGVSPTGCSTSSMEGR